MCTILYWCSSASKVGNFEVESYNGLLLQIQCILAQHISLCARFILEINIWGCSPIFPVGQVWSRRVDKSMKPSIIQ